MAKMVLLTREQILARKVAGRTEVVPLGDGTAVEVRGITRGEAAEIGKIDSEREDADKEAEIMALSFGLVNPALTLDEVREWYAGEASGAVQLISDMIRSLSGQAQGQGKEATKSVS